MTPRPRLLRQGGVPGGWLSGAGVVAALGWLLLADYHPMTLAVLVALFFCGYAGFRLMVFMDANRFTPRRLRVGLNWALVGFNAATGEYDIGPVRVYFLLLALLSAGLFLRPVVQGILG